MQHLQQALDAAILAKGTMHSHKRHIIMAAREGNHELRVCHIEHVHVLEPSLCQRLSHCLSRAMAHIALVCPASPEKCDVIFRDICAAHGRSQHLCNDRNRLVELTVCSRGYPTHQAI